MPKIKNIRIANITLVNSTVTNIQDLLDPAKGRVFNDLSEGQGYDAHESCGEPI